MMLMTAMNEVDLRRIDLNLLVALEVLLDERHVTNSANRLNLSQPAMSRTLARLRDTFGDQLLVRVTNGYELTARAEGLISPLDETLVQVRRTFSKPDFDPATATGEFKICTLGYGEVVVIPTLMDIITNEAPNIEIVIVHRSIYSAEENLDEGADIVFGAMLPDCPKYCVIQQLFEDRFVCVMRKGHPLTKTELTLDKYLEYPHSIIHTGERPGSHVDSLLEEHGHVRRIVKRSPHWTSSMMSLANTDLLQTVPERLAKSVTFTGGLTIRDLPFELGPLKLAQMWHARSNNDPRHKWFRDKFFEAAKIVSSKD